MSINASPAGIQIGAVTHHQDQSMVSVSLRTRNIKNKNKIHKKTTKIILHSSQEDHSHYFSKLYFRRCYVPFADNQSVGREAGSAWRSAYVNSLLLWYIQ